MKTHALKALAGAAAMAFALSVQAQELPQTIRMIVPFPPGGATDVLARLLSTKMAQSLGRTVVVDNKAGAGGQIGVQTAAQSKADGSVLLLSPDHSLVVIPLIMSNVAYDATRDFAPLGLIARFQWAMSSSASNGIKTLPDYLKFVQQNPDKANYGIPAAGGMPGMIGGTLSRRSGTNLVGVAYAGAAPLLTDVIGGQVSAGITGLAEAATMQRGGKVRILAISGESRSSVLPDIPTFAESGMPELSASSWQALFAPKGVPLALQKKLNTALNAALADPEVTQKLRELTLDPAPTSLEDASAELAKSNAFWTKAVNTPGSGAKP